MLTILLANLAAQRQAGDALATVRADLPDEPAIADILEATVKRFGRVEVLVNHASIGQGTIRADTWKNPVRFWEVEPAHWHRFTAVHGNPPFLLSRLVAPKLIAQGWGRIVMSPRAPAP
ncbi:MAG: SDR family NAD(P)-dependent oxidoreductase [Gemmatimonadales bacterium]